MMEKRIFFIRHTLSPSIGNQKIDNPD